MGDTEEKPSIQAFREYTKQAILAVSAVNSGAVLGCLVNIDPLIGLDGASLALKLWVSGLTMATCCWMAAYLANAMFKDERHTAELIFTCIGMLLFLGSVAAFCGGGWIMADALVQKP